MQAASLHYKLIRKIKDDRFEEDNIHQYHLLLNIGLRDLQVGVIDSTDQRILLLEDYVFPSLKNSTELQQILVELFDSHALLRAAFWKNIKVCFKNNKFVQVPEVLFVPGAEEEYLKYNSYIDEEDVLLDTFNPGLMGVTVFAIPESIKKFIDGLYPSNPPIYLHQSASLIEGVLHKSRNSNSNDLYLYVDRFKLHILSCGGGRLKYYNQFSIKQFSDYIKYIMLVMKSLQIDQAKSRIMLWGYIGKNSPHYHEFYKYISNVVFGTRPEFLKFGYIFDEIQDHHFFDLYNMHLLGNSPKA